MKSKARKRGEAEERRDRYDKLSRQQKLDKLNKGGFVAKKERARKGFPALKGRKGNLS